MIRLIFILGLGLFFFSCENEFIEANNTNRGEDYYPLISGKSITYQYDSVFYFNKGLNKVNSSGFLREEIGKEISKTNFETKYELLRYWRKNQTDVWQLVEIENITKTNNQIIVTDENLPFIRMVFPIKKDITWKGNALFNNEIITKIYGEDVKIFSNWEYKVTDLVKSFTYNNKVFADCAVVIETDKSTSLTRRYSKAVYAKGVGLLEREVNIYDTQRPLANQPWENYAEAGYSVKLRYIEHK